MSPSRPRSSAAARKFLNRSPPGIDFQQGRFLPADDGVLDARRAFQGANVPLRRCPALRHCGSDIVQHLDEYFADMRNGFAPFVRNRRLRCHRALISSGELSALERLRHGAAVHRRTKSGRCHEDVAQEAAAGRIGFTVDLLGEAVVSEEEAAGMHMAALPQELLSISLAKLSGWTDPLGTGAGAISRW